VKSSFHRKSRHILIHNDSVVRRNQAYCFLQHISFINSDAKGCPLEFRMHSFFVTNYFFLVTKGTSLSLLLPYYTAFIKLFFLQIFIHLEIRTLPACIDSVTFHVKVFVLIVDAFASIHMAEEIYLLIHKRKYKNSFIIIIRKSSSRTSGSKTSASFWQ
jgi:hypothetical protein